MAGPATAQKPQSNSTQVDAILRGAIDLHCHSGPSVMPRRLDHIEAIELGDMTHMPQRLEALEMIGSYAQFLGFDPEPLVRHYAHFLPRPAVASGHVRARSPPLPHPINATLPRDANASGPADQVQI